MALLLAFFLALLAIPLGAAPPEDPLSERLLSPVAVIREDAVTEFEQLPPRVQEQFVPTLMVALTNEDPEVAATASALLKKLGKTGRNPAPVVSPTQLAETSAARQRQQQESRRQVQQLKNDKYNDMRAALAEEKRQQSAVSLPDAPKADAAPQAGSRDQQVRQALVDGLRDPVPFVRSRSARRLAGLQPPPVEAVPDLIALLGDKDVEVRGSAAAALGAMGPAAKEALLSLRSLEQDPDPNVRAIARGAIEQIR